MLTYADVWWADEEFGDFVSDASFADFSGFSAAGAALSLSTTLTNLSGAIPNHEAGASDELGLLPLGIAERCQKEEETHGRKEAELLEVKSKLTTAENACRLELHAITREAVGAVMDTPEGLPGGFMRDDDTEILRVLRAHNSEERDGPVAMRLDTNRALALSTQYCDKFLRSRDALVSCRFVVEKGIFKIEGEECMEMLQRDAKYQEYLAVCVELVDACNAEDGLIGRVQKANNAIKVLADCLNQLLGESVVAITARAHCRSRTVIEIVALHDNWVARKLAQAQELRAKVKAAMTNLAVLLRPTQKCFCTGTVRTLLKLVYP